MARWWSDDDIKYIYPEGQRSVSLWHHNVLYIKSLDLHSVCQADVLFQSSNSVAEVAPVFPMYPDLYDTRWEHDKWSYVNQFYHRACPWVPCHPTQYIPLLGGLWEQMQPSYQYIYMHWHDIKAHKIQEHLYIHKECYLNITWRRCWSTNASWQTQTV